MPPPCHLTYLAGVYRLVPGTETRSPCNSIDRIGRRSLDDLAAARSDVEAEEILYCC